MKEVFNVTRDKMTKTANVLKEEYAAIRAGRANAAVLDKVLVDYYGVPTPINQMAAISVAEARILVIQPWDKSTLNPIYKAIQASDIGINPQNDGVVIRLTFPSLTEDRRKEIVRTSKSLQRMLRLRCAQSAVTPLTRLRKCRKHPKSLRTTSRTAKTSFKKLQTSL